MTQLSYQLFSSRNYDFAETIAMLAGVGFKNVEGFGAQYEDTAATKAVLDQHGMSMPSGHFAIELVEQTPEKAVEIAKALGIQNVIVPWIAPEDRPTDTAGWTAFADRLAAAAKPIVAAGLTFGYHNHDFEFFRTPEGDIPMDLIYAASSDIHIELDLAWVHVAGLNPVDYINAYGDRMIAAHIKDRAPAGDCADEDGWADLGHGEIDFAPIVDALRANNVGIWVCEHDNPSDHSRFATRSHATAITL